MNAVFYAFIEISTDLYNFIFSRIFSKVPKLHSFFLGNFLLFVRKKSEGYCIKEEEDEKEEEKRNDFNSCRWLIYERISIISCCIERLIFVGFFLMTLKQNYKRGKKNSIEWVLM